MDGGRPRPDHVLARDPDVELVTVDGELFGRSPRGLFALEGVDPEGLRVVLDRVDGVRSVAEIAELLEDELDPDEVVDLLGQLTGVVLRTVPAGELRRGLGDVRVGVLGAGSLAGAIVEELERGGARAITPLGSFAGDASGDRAADALAGVVAPLEVLVCALEGVPGQALLDVNAAALRTGTPVIFAAIEAGACVVGPLLLARRTPCFVCSRLSTSLVTHLAGRGPDLLAAFTCGEVTDATPRWMVQRAALDVAEDVARLFGGRAVPRRIGQLLSIRPSGSVALDDFDAVTTCPACRGRLGSPVGDAHAAPPPASPPPDGAVCDDAGGSRSVSPAEAERRARQALARLGIDLRCHALSSSAPDAVRAFACPYVHVEPVHRFTADAPVLFPRFYGQAFGKGTTDQQARCSGIFEWIERNMASWRGEHALVRASWNEVRDRAIDVPFLASGLLPGLELQRKRRFDPGAPIDWVWGHCLRSSRPILVPAASVFLGGGLFVGSDVELPSPGSSGLSAGSALGDAVLQGLLEVVERDAFSTALRCGVTFPAIDPVSIRDPHARALLDRMSDAGYEAHVRDITTDLGIPTREVYLVQRELRDYAHHFASGHGAHLDPDVALRRAVTEAAQSLQYLTSVGKAHPITSNASLFRFYPHRRQILERKGEPAGAAGAPPPSPGASVRRQIEEVVARVTAAVPRADVCFVDLSHPEMEGVHVVRSIITGTLHEVRSQQLHIPERVRLVPLEEMFLARTP